MDENNYIPTEMEDLIYKTEISDNEISKVQCFLISYLFHVKGLSSRQYHELDSRLPSHNTLNLQIKLGREYFKQLVPLMFQIRKEIKKNSLAIKEFGFIEDLFKENTELFDKMVQEKKVNLKMNESERKKLLNDFETNESMKRGLPSLYIALKEGKFTG